MDCWNNHNVIDVDFLEIPHSIFEEVKKSLENALPEEGCGLMAGSNGKICQVWPVTNVLHSTEQFLMDPQEQLNALIEIDDQGIELLAIYHSHPDGVLLPSRKDLNEFFYPDVVSLIGCKIETEWKFEGFIIKEQKYKKISIKCIDD